MAEISFLDRWDRQVHAVSALNNLHQLEVGRSYPLFAYERDRLEMRHFYHVASQTSGSTLHLGAPTLCASLDYDSGELLEVFPASELGLEPFEDITYSLTSEQRDTIRPRVQRLRRLYDRILVSYPHDEGGPDAKEFWATFQAVVPPLLLPYYEALAPDFVAWCQT